MGRKEAVQLDINPETGEVREVGYPVAYHDFYKTNGGDYRVFNSEPSRTRQEYLAECDINTIMANYQKTGVLPTREGEPFYADFTVLPSDLMGTLRNFADAEEAFMRLPAVVRKEFDNDPHQFIEFAVDPKNKQQMQDWDLAPKPKAPPEPIPVVVQAPAGEPAPGPAPSGSSAQGASKAP